MLLHFVLIRIYKGKFRVLFNIEKRLPTSYLNQVSFDKITETSMFSEVMFALTTICREKVNGSHSVSIKLVI